MKRFLLLFSALVSSVWAGTATGDLFRPEPMRLEQVFRLHLEPDRSYLFRKPVVEYGIPVPTEHFYGPAHSSNLDALGPGYRAMATTARKPI
jgi:hypothetical protein